MEISKLTMESDGFHRFFNPQSPPQIYYPNLLLDHSTHNHINLVSISESHVAEAPSETLKMDQMPCRYRNRRKTLGLAKSATLSSIIMQFCWLLVAFLSCRAFFRHPLMCYCWRFVSECGSSSSSCNQLVIGPRMKWRFRQLSFPSTKWYGDVIWIFDPGIIGIDSEGELERCFMHTPVHSNSSRQCLRIWWREIMLSLMLRVYLGKFLPWISLLIKEYERSSIVNFDAGLWGCLHGTRFRRWYSPYQQLWAQAITKKDVISYCWRCFNGKRCNRWIATNDRFKVYWSFVKKTIAKQDDHVGLRKKTNKEDNRFDNLLACKAYERKRRLIHLFDCIFFLNVNHFLIICVCLRNNYVSLFQF